MKPTTLFIAALGLFSTSATAQVCAKPGKSCVGQVLGHQECQCNAGIVLECVKIGNGPRTYQMLKNCPKPKNGGIRCIDGRCVG
ncbi:hypothetical protein KVT40_000565 [Elsinoe batatas]|uniref:Uncharacterized protein n=1 Tax=Elsinoe batatas TaxID=2601811 RepID=A0A8K0PGJ4_9PEZI|nr:hypothetical protein KVT40_000565 [Elsinoe batatas]